MELEQTILKLKEKEAAIAQARIVPRPLWGRLVYAFSTILSPWIFLLLLASTDYGLAEWQTGNLSTYIGILFGGPLLQLFAPFIIYGSLSMGLLLFDPNRFSQNRLVRLGVYSGTIVAVQYTLQILSTELLFGYGIGFAALIGYSVVFWLVYMAGRDADTPFVRSPYIKVLAVLLILFVIAAAISYGAGISLAILGIPLAGVVLTGPLGLITSWRLLTQVEFAEKESHRTLYFGSVWLTGYILTWSIAISKTLELYSQLPEQAPDCYIATASSRGHQALTGAVALRQSNGGLVMVSRQLQLLKGGELLIKTSWPRSHRLMRQLYDFIGPKIADRMASPWVADICYLLLKPFEWGAWLFIRICMPTLLQKIYRIYYE